jgi:hypothetical protein
VRVAQLAQMEIILFLRQLHQLVVVVVETMKLMV